MENTGRDNRPIAGLQPHSENRIKGTESLIKMAPCGHVWETVATGQYLPGLFKSAITKHVLMIIKFEMVKEIGF